MLPRTRFSFLSAAILLLSGSVLQGKASSPTLKVKGGEVALENVPVHAAVRVPGHLRKTPADNIVVRLRAQGIDASIPGQVFSLSKKEADVWWIIPSLPAGSEMTFEAALSEEKNKSCFSWKDQPNEHLDLLREDKKLLRYMYAYKSTEMRFDFNTSKPFHHVFDPQGEATLTNGPGPGEILYPHHRGIFIGWNKVMLEGQRYDLWHTRNVAQVHQEFLEQQAGPVAARSVSRIHWNDLSKEPILSERREITVFAQPEPTHLLLEFQTAITALRDQVLLDGDPEHGGFQYRPHNDADKTRTQYLFHEEGIDPRKDKDLPWVGESYVLRGNTYTVQHINHPSNPNPTIYSAYRDYGRFGAFFKKSLSKGETLHLKYRIWIASGDHLDREAMQRRWLAFCLQ